MKMLFTVTAACALALAVSGSVFAQGSGRMGGCNECNQGLQGAESTDPLRKFQLDTLDLRQEMMVKRFEMQRENLKGTPDTGKMAALKAEVSSIQARINNIRVLSGLPDKGKRDGECYKIEGGCNKQNGMGGCNGQPCGQK